MPCGLGGGITIKLEDDMNKNDIQIYYLLQVEQGERKKRKRKRKKETDRDRKRESETEREGELLKVPILYITGYV